MDCRKLFIAADVVCFIVAAFFLYPYLVPAYPLASLQNDEIESISFSYIGDPPEYILSPELQEQCVSVLHSIAAYKEPQERVYVGEGPHFNILKKDGEWIRFEYGDIVVFINDIHYRTTRNDAMHDFLDYDLPAFIDSFAQSCPAD